MKKEKKISLIIAAIVLAGSIFLGYLFLGNNIGIQQNKIISDIRESQKIDDNWETCLDSTKETAAGISYPTDKSDHTYSIYVNRKGLSFGYFFRGGGDNSVIDNSIAEFTITGYSDRAFISMNRKNIVKVEIDTENGIETRNFESNEPFVFVLENNAGNVTFYDTDGKVVEYINQPL